MKNNGRCLMENGRGELLDNCTTDYFCSIIQSSIPFISLLCSTVFSVQIAMKNYFDNGLAVLLRKDVPLIYSLQYLMEELKDGSVSGIIFLEGFDWISEFQNAN
jgi:hypothetical protein